MKWVMIFAMLGAAMVGCQKDVARWELKSMEEQCTKHGGIYQLDNFPYTNAVCEDGVRVKPRRGKNE